MGLKKTSFAVNKNNQSPCSLVCSPIIIIISVYASSPNIKINNWEEKSVCKYTAPHSDHFNPYQQYKMKLDNNAYLLRNQFPSQSLNKIKELLDELDNNLEMAR